MGELDGKVVIVTGAAQGMGQRHAERCVAAGARVIATDVQEALGREVVAGLGENARFVPHDVTDEAAWARVVSTAVAEFGGLDGLVNNAAIYRGTCPIEDEPLSVFELTLRINVVGTWLGIKNVIAPIRERGGGAIVNVSSIAGMKGLPGFGSYGSSKWAVRGLTKVAAKELGEHGIRVNSVHPGGIEGTGMFTPAQTAAERKQRYSGVPLGRAGNTDEVSSLVIFLLSEASSYVTGVEHVIDGGSIV
ncbi:MAG TPA: glucose 1-dehydrogenase [Acidimicrobiales bacterium]|nr:glucose 1-dehydrogenase [Acidimicrobiales bacterium]